MRNGDFSELLALGSAVPDLQPVHDPADSDASRALHPRSVPRQHHSAELDRLRRRRRSWNTSRCPIRRARPTVSRTTRIRQPSRSRPTTPQRAASITTSRAKHRIYGRFSWDFWEEEKDDRFDNIATGIFLNRKNRILGLDDAYTIRNNLLMNVRGGFTRQMFPERRRSQGFDLSTLGFSPAARLARARESSRRFRSSTTTASRTSASRSRATVGSPPTCTRSPAV